MRNSATYYETPWLRRCDCGPGCGAWMCIKGTLACDHGLMPWEIGDASRIKVVITTKETAGAIMSTNPAWWLPEPIATSDRVWWWVEVPV